MDAREKGRARFYHWNVIRYHSTWIEEPAFLSLL